MVEAERRHKEDEERSLTELEEKKEVDRLDAEQILLEDITTTVIAYAELETAEAVRRNKEEEEIRMAAEAEEIRMAEVIRKEKEDVELVAALQEEEEAKAADTARKIAAETQTATTGLLDVPVVSAQHPEEASASEGNVTIVPFLSTILRSEQFTFSPATSSVVVELQGFMTQVAVNVERNVNMVMKSLEENKKLEEERRIREEERRIKDEERKAKEDFYSSSLATLFDLVKKGEEDKRKEKEERLAREAQEEARRQEQFQEMLRVMQGRIPRSPASTSSPPP